jgi:RNA polymerase sigma factor (sigma-70 family)
MDTDDDASDQTLWDRTVTGDGRAFAELFRRHRDRVFFFALRASGNPHDAEDVAAMVFLEAWNLRPRVRLVDGSLRPWLLVTANNVMRNHSRSRIRYARLLQHLPQVEHQADHSESVLNELESSPTRAYVREAFQRLSVRDQEILALCVLEGLPISTVSGLLGLPLASAKTRLHRAKKRLSDSIQPAEYARLTSGL